MSEISRGYEWQKTRSEVIERDGGECQGCGMNRPEHKDRYGADLEVHHKAPAHIFVDDDGETYEQFAHHKKNLVTLCSGCHRWAGDKGRYALGFMPKPGIRQRYTRLKPFRMSNTEFIEQLLDCYETVQDGEMNVIEPRMKAEVDASDLAAEIADELKDKYTGVDEADLASRVANDVERRLRGW